MLCDKCKIHEATIHLTEIIKNDKSELHLCELCAQNIGLNAKLSNFALSIPEMLSFLDISEVDTSSEKLACHRCGSTYIEFKREGKVGCAECYEHLKTQLTPAVASYQQNTNHIGKNPKNQAERSLPHPIIETEKKSQHNLEELYKQLEDAILEEEYETAAILRDRIKEIAETGVGFD